MCSIDSCLFFVLIRKRGIKFNVPALLNIAFARQSWVGVLSFGCDHNVVFFVTFFLSSTDPPVIANMFGKEIVIQEIYIIMASSFCGVLL